MNSLKTPKPLLAARMAFPLAASLITVLLGEWIARGALTADTVTSFIFPHAEAYLLAGCSCFWSGCCWTGSSGCRRCLRWAWRYWAAYPAR